MPIGSQGSYASVDKPSRNYVGEALQNTQEQIAKAIDPSVCFKVP